LQLSEFWQSDGTAPHIVSIQFRARTAVTEVAFYVDAASDESYTPRIVSVRAGTLHHDLEELRRVEMTSPTGWIRIPLAAPKGIRTWYLQIVVHQMRANGRDLHLRGLRILGPGAGASPGVHAVGAGVGDSLPLGAGLLTSLFRDIQLSGTVR
jgi:anaphase-promoting complex subunit 10